MKQAKKERKLDKLSMNIMRLDKQLANTRRAFDELIKLVGNESDAGRTATIKYEYMKNLLNAKRQRYVSEFELLQSK